MSNVVQLATALKAVLELHHPREQSTPLDAFLVVCAECSGHSDDDWALTEPWPCSTVQAVLDVFYPIGVSGETD